MAQTKGGKGGNGGKTANSKGSSQKIADRMQTAQDVADNKKAVAKQREKARVAMGPAWYVEQNAGRSSDKEAFIAGMPGPYSWPGEDKPSVHLNVEYRPSKDGTKRELVVVYLHAHEGYTHEGNTFEDHSLKGLRKETFVKAAWLSKSGFQSIAANPSIKKAQELVVGYMQNLFGGPITVQNTTIDIEKVDVKETSNTAPAKSASVITEFPLENETENPKGKEAQISFDVKAGKVVITMVRSAKYSGPAWGYVPFKAFLHTPDGGSRSLWELHQQDKGLELFYNLVQTAEDGFIVVGTKGKGKEKALFTAVSLTSEAGKVEVVGNDNILTLTGGMSIIALVNFKQKMASLLGANPRFTTEEDAIKSKMTAAKSKVIAARKAEEEERKAREAGERRAKMIAEIEANNKVIVYNERGEELEMLEVDNDHVAKMLPPDLHVVFRNSDGSATHKVVRKAANGSKYLVNGAKVSFERPTFEGLAKVLDTKVSFINDEHGLQEVMVVHNHQSMVTLRAQGLNGGAYVAYRDETDGQMVVNQVFVDKIEEVARLKELEAY
jgi:hypothetical protein